MEETEKRDLYRFGPFLLNASDRSLAKGDLKVTLRPKAFQVLEYFLARPRALVTREQLLATVWQTTMVDPSVIDGRIKEVRDTLRRHDPNVEYIENQHGLGWRFVVPVHLNTPGTEHPVIGPARRRLRLSAPLAISVVLLVFLTSPVFRTFEPRIADFRQLTTDGRPKGERLVTDGRTIYFSESAVGDLDGEMIPAAIPASGGDVSFNEEAPLLDISRGTGDRLVGHYGRFSLNVLDSQGLPTGIDGSQQPTISPDGKAIAYSDRTTLIIKEQHTSEQRRIAVPGIVRLSRWSPDGRTIRFNVQDGTGERSVMWEVRRDGSRLRQLPYYLGNHKDLEPGDWTPDGRYFFFTELDTYTKHSNIWTVREDASGERPVRLTRGPIDFRSPIVARDGSTVFAIGTKSREETARFDAKRGDFVSLWGGLAAVDVEFQNDGRSAAYVRYPDRTLWICQSDGTRQRQLTWPPLETNQPHWSPDGDQIAFIGRMPGRLWRIYVIPSSGGVPREIAPDDPYEQGVPTWSNGARYLVFGERRRWRGDDVMEVHVFDIAHQTEHLLPNSRGMWSPRWSRDGRYIVAATTDFGSLQLFDCQSEKWGSLVRGRAIDDATWSADSRFVHFSALIETGRALFRVSVADGKIEKLAIQPASAYQWSGAGVDGSPLVLRSVRLEDIYALDWRPQ